MVNKIHDNFDLAYADTLWKSADALLGLLFLKYISDSFDARESGDITCGDDGYTLLADGKGDSNPESDLGRIVYAFRQWREGPKPDWCKEKKHGPWAYRDIPGFCKFSTIEEIKKHAQVLTPGRYVGGEAQEADDEPFSEKYPKMLAEFEECLGEGERLSAVVREKLGGLEDGG